MNHEDDWHSLSTNLGFSKFPLDITWLNMAMATRSARMSEIVYKSHLFPYSFLPANQLRFANWNKCQQSSETSLSNTSRVSKWEKSSQLSKIHFDMCELRLRDQIIGWRVDRISSTCPRTQTTLARTASTPQKPRATWHVTLRSCMRKGEITNAHCVTLLQLQGNIWVYM